MLTVGIVANEFFDTKFGRVGGFGWAAKCAADVLLNHPSSHAEVCYITPGEFDGADSKRTVSGEFHSILFTRTGCKNCCRRFG